MLVQMPRGPADQPTQKAGECSPFEAALRRDLATAPVVSYDATLGGWSKRTVDLSLTILSMPVWLPLLAGLAIWAKERSTAPVFLKEERIGYGGRPFTHVTLRLSTPSAVIERLHPANEEEGATSEDGSALAGQAEDRNAKWLHALERLPQLFSVLRGEMALVGPAPLTREELAEVKTAKRYYLSARPGVVSTSGVADAHDEHASQYKIYALGWSHETDMLILWDAARRLLDQGELWRPTRRVLKTRESPPVNRVRRAVAE